jgi:hypothetical protein
MKDERICGGGWAWSLGGCEAAWGSGEQKRKAITCDKFTVSLLKPMLAFLFVLYALTCKARPPEEYAKLVSASINPKVNKTVLLEHNKKLILCILAVILVSSLLITVLLQKCVVKKLTHPPKPMANVLNSSHVA